MDHSPLYQYLLDCWLYNPDFTETNLHNAVLKGYITEAEEQEILAQPRQC